GEDLSSADGLLAATTLGVYRLVPERAGIAMAPAKLTGPTLAELVRQASRYSLYDGERQRRWQRAAKISAWLPIVRGEYRYQWDDNHGGGYDEVRDANGVLIALDPTGD